ncbi:PadR family transcriptional regulator [Stakelama tenebrarum]|uniref:Transcription regulator PadR N-terminal domain-containing protein n=1 Tax=Stakelama tenebrarum TaxID=2711215 RepID=A0A6G6Y7Y5_9SPHN|nr:helix-turn-helix transcriptional regulator [Sphingosinithalassobacter tenebrarum]QIG81052.1 hypothetical protein G5C33_15515 [Sphingosinithalassobacter tenebrarum]
MTESSIAPAAEQALTLSDSEGTFLGLVLRAQPITAYQVAKVYDRSPVSNFNTSKGKIYPLMRRLVERGLLVKEQVAGDARGTEQLRCTDLGREAVRQWVLEARETHVMLEDPLRTKVQSFDLLTPAERIEWILSAKESLAEQLDRLESYQAGVDVPFKEFVHDNAVRSVQARIAWLDRMLAAMLRETAAQSGS